MERKQIIKNLVKEIKGFQSSKIMKSLELKNKTYAILQNLGSDREFYHLNNNEFEKEVQKLNQQIFQLSQSNISSNKKLKEVIEEIIQSFPREEVRWVGYVRIIGIKFEPDRDENNIMKADENLQELDLGDFQIVNINILNHTGERLYGEFSEYRQQFTKDNERDKLRWWTTFYHDIIYLTQVNNYFIRVTVNANNSHTATLRLKKKIGLAIPILNLLALNSRETRIGLPNVVKLHDNSSNIVISKYGLHYTLGKKEEINLQRYLVFNPKRITKMIDLYHKFSIIRPIISGSIDTITKLQSAILRSFFWHNQAELTENNNFILISQIFCLETIFVPERDLSKKGEMMAFRIMLLEYLTDGGFRRPDEIYNLYALRSNIVHGSDLLEDHDLPYQTDFFNQNLYSNDIDKLNYYVSDILREVLIFINNTNKHIDTLAKFIRLMYQDQVIVRKSVDWILNYFREDSDFFKFFERNKEDIITNKIKNIK